MDDPTDETFHSNLPSLAWDPEASGDNCNSGIFTENFQLIEESYRYGIYIITLVQAGTL